LKNIYQTVVEISTRFRYSNILKLTLMLADCAYVKNLIPLQNLKITPHLQWLSTAQVLGENLQFYFDLSTEILDTIKKSGLPSLLTQHRWLLGQAFECFIHSVLENSNTSEWQNLFYLSTW